MNIKTVKKIFVISAAYYIIMCISQSHTKTKLKCQKESFYTQSSQHLIIITFQEIKPFSFFFIYYQIALCGRCQLYVIFTVMILDKKLIVPKIC